MGTEGTSINTHITKSIRTMSHYKCTDNKKTLLNRRQMNRKKY
jgi:hypothetical protein